MQLTHPRDFIRVHGELKDYMFGISIQISKPGSDSKPAELARVLKDDSRGGIVRKTGYETYEALDTQAKFLQGLLELLEDYGNVVGYDPTKSRFSAPTAA